LNAIYGYRFNRVSIRNQKTCWGSCSRKGNLNFNYRILFLPERTQNYIIAHELSHLAEFNHSKKFWALVARTSPEYAAIRKELRRSGMGFR
jgi:predicted metal-dependent hydrolase